MMHAAFNREAVDALMTYHASVPDLRPKGKRLVGHCPLHSEKTASFTVDPSKKVFYCHGCGAGGDAITLTMLLHKVSFVQAAKKLGAWKNIAPAERTRLWRERQKAAKAHRLREYHEARVRELFLQMRSILLLLESIARHCVKLLERGLDDATADSVRETMCLAYSLIREYSAGFTLLAFGSERARMDYANHPERRHRWHEKILERGFVHDDRGRVTEVLL